MASLAEQYTDEIYGQRRYWATWEPNVHVALGSCGSVTGREFRPEGSLANYGIDFDIEPDPESSDVDYSSRSGLTLTFQTEAGSNKIPNIPQGTAGMKVSFGRQQAAVIATKGAREHRIADQDRLRRDLLRSAARPQGGFPPGWFVITHVVTCTSASVLIAQGSNAGFEVSADADFSAGVVDLANANLNFTIQSENQIGYKMLAESGATPLFRGLRLKRTWYGSDKIEALGPDAPASQLATAFEELTPATAGT
jgi:hypothetical protein